MNHLLEDKYNKWSMIKNLCYVKMLFQQKKVSQRNVIFHSDGDNIINKPI